MEADRLLLDPGLVGEQPVLEGVAHRPDVLDGLGEHVDVVSGVVEGDRGARGGGDAPWGLEVECDADGCQMGDRLSFRVTPPVGRPHFAAFARAPDGAVLWYFPATPSGHSVDTSVRIVDGVLAGIIGVADPIKESTPEALRMLRDEGVHVFMITGDDTSTAAAVAETSRMHDDRDVMVAPLRALMVPPSPVTWIVSRMGCPANWAAKFGSSLAMEPRPAVSLWVVTPAP